MPAQGAAQQSRQPLSPQTAGSPAVAGEPGAAGPAVAGAAGELVAAAVAGDQSAFAALTQRYRRELHVHCYRMLASFDDAEDAVQDAFLRAWRGRDGFDGGTMCRAWLYRRTDRARRGGAARPGPRPR